MKSIIAVLFVLILTSCCAKKSNRYYNRSWFVDETEVIWSGELKSGEFIEIEVLKDTGNLFQVSVKHAEEE